MKMITGGAFQGKTSYAVHNFGILAENIKDGEKCGFDEVFGAKCIVNYHLLVKRLIDNGIEPMEFTEQLCSENSDTVVIINEIGCGIVPIEKSERIWREQVGRCGCIIAGKSQEVVRVIGGIGVVIKGGI